MRKRPVFSLLLNKRWPSGRTKGGLKVGTKGAFR
jgi:hypothetical protein